MPIAPGETVAIKHTDILVKGVRTVHIQLGKDNAFSGGNAQEIIVPQFDAATDRVPTGYAGVGKKLVSCPSDPTRIIGLETTIDNRSLDLGVRGGRGLEKCRIAKLILLAHIGSDCVAFRVASQGGNPWLPCVTVPNC